MMASTVVCRSCSRDGLETVLDLGATPLANDFRPIERLDEPLPRYPLMVVFCPACALIQLTETVAPETLFSQYPYFSSVSDTVLENARAIATRLCSERHLDASSRVVEVASNDGYLLQFYQARGVPVLGIEPASNVARVAMDHGVPTLVRFFSKRLAEELRAEGVLADILHANNVLAHVPDLNGFMAGIGVLLKESGTAVIEVPYVRDMIEKVEFDTIYHEHLCYFSVTALDRICRRNGLVLYEAERLGIHGGSLRIFVSPFGSPSTAVTGLLDEEAGSGVDTFSFFEHFSERVAKLKAELLSLLRGLKTTGKRIAAYGASAKGMTLLNCLGIGSDLIDFVVDRSPAKQGLFTPGTNLPIFGPEKLLESMPDYALLLAWNIADEVLAQQEAYRRRGGRFIIPLPVPVLR